MAVLTFDGIAGISAALPLPLRARLLQGPPSQPVCGSGDRNLPPRFLLSLAYCIDRLSRSLARDEGPLRLGVAIAPIRRRPVKKCRSTTDRRPRSQKWRAQELATCFGQRGFDARVFARARLRLVERPRHLRRGECAESAGILAGHSFKTGTDK